MKKILFNAATLTSSQAIIYLIQITVIIHLVTNLELEKYGIVAFSQAFVAAILTLLDLGFGVSATDKIAYFRNNKKYVAKIFGSIYLIKIILFIICIICTYIIFRLTNKYDQYELIIHLSMLQIFVMTLIPSWFFYGIEKFHQFSLITVFSKFIFAISIIVFVKDGENYFYVPILNTLCQIMIIIYSLCVIRKMGYFILLPNRTRFIFYTLNFTKNFFSSRLAIAFNTNIAVLLIGSFASPTFVAIYSLGDQIYRVLQTLVSSFNLAIYPHMSATKNIILMKKIILIFSTALLFFTFAAYLMIPLILQIFFEDKLNLLVPVINVFLLIFCVNSMGAIFGYPLYAAAGRLDVANNSLVAGALIYLLILVLLIFFNMVDPFIYAIALLMSEFYVLAHRVVFFRLLSR